MKETALHEILHVVFKFAGHKDDGFEQLLEMIAWGLVHATKENPWLFDMFLQPDEMIPFEVEDDNDSQG